MRHLFLALLLCGATSLKAQRNVHWIHGLGGAATSWQQFSNEFGGQRQMPVNTHNGYQTGNGVGGMATDIQNQIGGTAGGTALGICHSMGWVAGRQLDVRNTGLFGGIITFGSPLRGARIANNVNNGVANDYVCNAVSQLRKGPFRQFAPIPQIALQVFGIRDIDNFVGNMVIQQQRTDLSLTPATANDLSEESGYNQQFYGNSTPTPKLVYWGNEVSPVHVRLFAGSVDIDEEAAVNSFNGVRQFYGAARDINYTLRWVFPLAFPLYNWYGNGWADGYDYLRDQSENEWSNLIGAGYSYTQPVTYYEYIGTDFTGYDDCVNNANGDPNQIQTCESTYFRWVTRDITFYVRDPSDGLVPRRSQIGEGTAWANSNAEVRELPENSHNEMRRSDRSRGELTEAFNGNRGGGNFFIPFR